MNIRGITALFGMIATATMLSACGKENTNVSLGMAAIEELQYQEALEDFDLAVMNDEDMQLINRGRGIAYIGLSEYENAIDCLTLSLQNSNGHITDLEFDTNFYLALAHYKNKDYSEAIEIYSSIITMDKDYVDAYYNRGLSYLMNGQVELAVLDFDKAIELEPKDYSRYIDAYCSLVEKGYRDLGNSYLEKALTVNDRKQSDYDKGRIYYYLGQYNEALSCFDAATRSTGGDAYLYLGKSYEALGDYNYASSVYLNYLTDHEDAEIYNQLGLCKMAMGSYQEALDAFQKGIEQQDAAVLQSLKLNEVTAYEYLGNFEQARILLSNYLTLYPNDEEALREYSFLQTR